LKIPEISDYSKGVVRNPTILPARNRNRFFPIPELITTKYDIMLMFSSQKRE